MYVYRVPVDVIDLLTHIRPDLYSDNCGKNWVGGWENTRNRRGLVKRNRGLSRGESDPRGTLPN